MNLNECLGLGLTRVCQVNEKTNGASPYHRCLSIVLIYLLTVADVSANYRILAIKAGEFGRRAALTFLLSPFVIVVFKHAEVTDWAANI